LSQISQKSYLPSVENPINTLKGDFGSFVDHYVKSDGALNEPIVPAAGAFVFVQFDASEEASFAEHGKGYDFSNFFFFFLNSYVFLQIKLFSAYLKKSWLTTQIHFSFTLPNHRRSITLHTLSASNVPLQHPDKQTHARASTFPMEIS
jgi:hypothetical protein